MYHIVGMQKTLETEMIINVNVLFVYVFFPNSVVKLYLGTISVFS